MNNNCQIIFKQGTKPLITPVELLTMSTGRKQVILSYVLRQYKAEMQWSATLSFCFVGLRSSKPQDTSWNKCTTLLNFRQLVGHFSLSSPHPVMIFQEDFQEHEFGSASVRLPLYTLFTCQNLVLHSAFFRDGNKSGFIWKGWCVQVWIWREETQAWSPLVCQHADSISFSRNILAFMQRTPIPILLVGSEKSKRCTSEEYQRGDI